MQPRDADTGPGRPQTSDEDVRATREKWAVLKRRVIMVSPAIFCLFLVLDWTGITDGGFPTNWGDALLQVGANLLWTLLLTVLSWLVIRPNLDPPSGEGKAPSRPLGQDPQQSR